MQYPRMRPLVFSRQASCGVAQDFFAGAAMSFDVFLNENEQPQANEVIISVYVSERIFVKNFLPDIYVFIEDVFFFRVHT